MNSDQLIDTIIRYVERKGIVTDESFLRRGHLFMLFNTVKSRVQSNLMISGVTLTGKNYLKTVIDKSSFESTSTKFSYFEAPPAVMNSYEFVGGTDGCTQFRENLTMSDFLNTCSQQVPAQTEYLYVNEYLKVNKTTVPSILLNFIPVNPMKVKTWNYEFDEYPIDEALIDSVCEEMFRTYQSKSAQAPLDTVSDSAESTKSI